MESSFRSTNTNFKKQVSFAPVEEMTNDAQAIEIRNLREKVE
jgi:hypothetical protein